MEAHGGRIWAESDGIGLGARFSFTLPMVEEAGSAIESGLPSLLLRSSLRTVRAGEPRARVLAVDDDPQDLRYVRDTLAKVGYIPIVTGDPEEALRLMEGEKHNEAQHEQPSQRQRRVLPGGGVLASGGSRTERARLTGRFLAYLVERVERDAGVSVVRSRGLWRP